jgi:hypothetical protein
MFDLPSRKDPREYVITDRHVRREEAIVPHPVKTKKEPDKKETA